MAKAGLRVSGIEQTTKSGHAGFPTWPWVTNDMPVVVDRLWRVRTRWRHFGLLGVVHGRGGGHGPPVALVLPPRLSNHAGPPRPLGRATPRAGPQQACARL